MLAVAAAAAAAVVVVVVVVVEAWPALERAPGLWAGVMDGPAFIHKGHMYIYKRRKGINVYLAIMVFDIVLHCIVLYCIVLCCIVLYCIALHCIVALHCCNALYMYM